MKSTIFLSLLSVAYASPPPANAQYMNLLVSSNIQSINEQYLSISTRTKFPQTCAQIGNRRECSDYYQIGLSESVGRDYNKSPRFWYETVAGTGTLALHAGDSRRTVGLIVKPNTGLYDLVDIENPMVQTFPRGYAAEWATLVIGSDGSITVKDGNEAAQPRRRWVVYAETGAPRGTLNVALYDGVTMPQTYNFVNITLSAVGA